MLPLVVLLFALVAGHPTLQAADPLPWIAVSADRTGFVMTPGGTAFCPRGFNYDRDDSGRLLEDYWETEWSTVEADFAEMKQLGANVVRVHLQFGKFMENASQPRADALRRLTLLLKLAEKECLYLDLTGLGCYHKRDVPAWYDALAERDRWNAQANFWRAIATTCADSPAVFCYDLMNEPVVPGGKRKNGDWLGPAFGGKHYVQVISLDQQNRPRHEIAALWVAQLTAAIREIDSRHLVTVGLVDWSLDRPGLTSGFRPDKVTMPLDFVSVHLYPEAGKTEQALETLAAFQVGKPIVIEETFPLKCSMKEFSHFLIEAQQHACGYIGFYWGKTPQELRLSDKAVDRIVLEWLDFFQSQPGTTGLPRP